MCAWVFCFSSWRFMVNLSRFMAWRCQSNPAELTKGFSSFLSSYLLSFLPSFFPSFFFPPTPLWFKDSLFSVISGSNRLWDFVYWNGVYSRIFSLPVGSEDRRLWSIRGFFKCSIHLVTADSIPRITVTCKFTEQAVLLKVSDDFAHPVSTLLSNDAGPC